MQKNLDQLRAAHALKEADKIDKTSVAKLPGMILSNGLLGTLAFAGEQKGPREGLKAAADSLARHLAQPVLGLSELAGITSAQKLAEKLAGGDALTLQRAITESLAYLSYLKRYAAKKSSADQES